MAGEKGGGSRVSQGAAGLARGGGQPRQTGLVAFLGAVIGLLGGLIGLGGAEFRLPVLVGLLGYTAREGVPLNLAVSMVTMATALVVRSGTLSLTGVAPLSVALAGLIGGGVIAAFWGAGVARRLPKERLERVILVLLVGIGATLMVEGFLPSEAPGFVPGCPPWAFLAGLAFGLAIGTVSSLLGVAGGEIIIPTLVYAFGADIRTAGTASLLVSLPTVAAGAGPVRPPGGLCGSPPADRDGRPDERWLSGRSRGRRGAGGPRAGPIAEGPAGCHPHPVGREDLPWRQVPMTGRRREEQPRPSPLDCPGTACYLTT